MKKAMIFLILLSLCACALNRKLACGPAKVIAVSETEHSYFVTLIDDCQTITQTVAK